MTAGATAIRPTPGQQAQSPMDSSELATQGRRHGISPKGDMDEALETENFIRICSEARDRLGIDPNHYVNMERAFRHRHNPEMPAYRDILDDVSQQDGPMRGVEPSLARPFLEMVSAIWLQWRRANRLEYRRECEHYHEPEEVCSELNDFQEWMKGLLSDLAWAKWAEAEYPA